LRSTRGDYAERSQEAEGAGDGCAYQRRAIEGLPEKKTREKGEKKKKQATEVLDMPAGHHRAGGRTLQKLTFDERRLTREAFTHATCKEPKKKREKEREEES